MQCINIQGYTIVKVIVPINNISAFLNSPTCFVVNTNAQYIKTATETKIKMKMLHSNTLQMHLTVQISSAPQQNATTPERNPDTQPPRHTPSTHYPYHRYNTSP